MKHSPPFSTENDTHYGRLADFHPLLEDKLQGREIVGVKAIGFDWIGINIYLEKLKLKMLKLLKLYGEEYDSFKKDYAVFNFSYILFFRLCKSGLFIFG